MLKKFIIQTFRLNKILNFSHFYFLIYHFYVLMSHSSKIIRLYHQKVNQFMSIYKKFFISISDYKIY